jgi:hypothetical protein
MKLVPVLLAAMTLAVLSAGCVHDKPPGPVETATQSTSTGLSESNTSTDGTMQPPMEEAPLTLLLNNCLGWTTVLNYPGPTAPGPRPEGWEAASPDTLITGISIQAYECNRVAIGAFERGPLHVLYEAHSNADIPEACYEGLAGITSVGILTAFILDDAELVAFLQSELKLPAVFGTITDDATAVGPGAVHTWTWQVEGNEQSTLTLPESGDTSGSGVLPERLFWENNGTLHQIDLAPLDHGPQVPAWAVGSIHAPFYTASDTGGVFTGGGTRYVDRESSGTFTSYRDMACKVPQ